jgi:hypothetical protein
MSDTFKVVLSETAKISKQPQFTQSQYADALRAQLDYAIDHAEVDPFNKNDIAYHALAMDLLDKPEIELEDYASLSGKDHVVGFACRYGEEQFVLAYKYEHGEVNRSQVFLIPNADNEKAKDVLFKAGKIKSTAASVKRGSSSPTFLKTSQVLESVLAGRCGPTGP